MKLAAVALAVSISTLLPSAALLAADETKPGAAGAAKPAATPAAPADAQWTELEGMFTGPKKRPTSREEAMKLFKEYFVEYDAKADAWRKANPNDPRRFKLMVHEARSNGARSGVNLPAKSDAEIAKNMEEILAAADADKATKAQASYVRVQLARNKPEEFAKLAEAHMKEYPDLPENRALASQIKSAEAEKTLQSKPLEMKFTAMDGAEVDLSKMRGKVVLVDFWATWCGPCVAELPNVLAAYSKLHDKGFEIIGISFDDDKKKLENFVKEKGMAWPQYFDGKGWQNQFGQQYGINSIPRMWLVNKQGMVVDTNARQDLAGKVEKLLAE
jgi:thiol-disulfide isomerase/thioredoxin